MMRIICCGNRDRGDDAAGVLVAERLRDMGISIEVYEGDPLAMIDSWDPADDVIVVDATVTGSVVGTVQLWDAPIKENLVSGSSSTHGLGVVEAIHLAEILGRLPRRLRVYGIEGKQFQAEASVSHEVQQAVETVARRIAGEVIPAAACVVR
jgi:hydrogenase maturation protease